MTDDVPAVVWRSAGVDPSAVVNLELDSFGEGTGAASGHVQLITAAVRDSDPVRIVRKTFARLAEGRHAEAARRPDHWAHWRRELTAYDSGVLPAGPGLRAPRLYGVVDDTLYIEYVGMEHPSAAVAAAALGRWHGADHVVDDAEQYQWLTTHQLAQRLAVNDLDWSVVDLDPDLESIWQRRQSYLATLDTLPWSITHGDFSTANLRAHEGDLVVIDWATLGTSPVGFDIAHLALAVLNETLVDTYLGGLRGRYDSAAVRLGYRISVALVGASRAHWMASRSISIPSGYTDFIRAHAPSILT